MSTDLHAAIFAAIEHLEQTARAAQGATSSAAWWPTADPLGYHVEPLDAAGRGAGRIVLRAGCDMGANPDESAAIAGHIALNDPASVLRRCAAARRVLDRHRHDSLRDGAVCCRRCGWVGEPGLTEAQAAAVGVSPSTWDGHRACADIRDLADSLGIQTTE